MTALQIAIAAMSLVVIVLAAVVGVVWKLSKALSDLSIAISGLKTEIVENTMKERERTDLKIKQAVDYCRTIAGNCKSSGVYSTEGAI